MQEKSASGSNHKDIKGTHTEEENKHRIGKEKNIEHDFLSMLINKVHRKMALTSHLCMSHDIYLLNNKEMMRYLRKC